MKIINQFTYCALGKDKKNKVIKLGSPCLDCWKAIYRQSLFLPHEKPLTQPLDAREYYCDPDQTYKKGYNHKYFNDIVSFLDNREKELVNNLEGNYSYEFVENEGIKVSYKNDNKLLFYLRSDQLGFSAPSNQESHPYDLYIEKSDYSNEAKEQVASWIAESRTIGGSFLWPSHFYDSYNPQRGGTINSNRRYYIQDRVDLTLWEIHYYYNDKDKNTILKRCNKLDSNLDIWLNHFKNFETYINFFCLDAFVKRNEDMLNPINILDNDTKEPKWGKKGENPEIEISSDLSKTEIEDMLKFINDSILKRTETITNLLSKSSD